MYVYYHVSAQESAKIPILTGLAGGSTGAYMEIPGLYVSLGVKENNVHTKHFCTFYLYHRALLCS